jgi:endonuclease/exonuclease/phosphatase (EEP) superfamily protein YafD
MRRAIVLVLVLAVTSTGCAISVAPDGTMRHVEGTTVSETLDPASVRVLVWNVYKASLPGWWLDFERLAAAHDLFLLQEGSWEADAQAQHRALGVDWWMGVTFVSPWSEGDPATGTIVGGRAPVHGATSRHSRYLEPVLGTPKSHSFGRFELAGRDEELLALSIHAINFRLGLTAFGDHVRLALRDVAGHAGPVIVAGDFNTWSQERTGYLFETMTRLGFRSVYPRSAESAPSDGRTAVGDCYLDHAFIRGLEVVGEPRVLRAVDTSDHEALSFVVRVP